MALKIILKLQGINEMAHLNEFKLQSVENIEYLSSDSDISDQNRRDQKPKFDKKTTLMRNE